ncbi:MAG: DUF3783 domain-containing protein [Roseburia sp.]
MEKLLLFHLSDTDQQKTKQIASNLKIPCETIDASLYTQTLESLISGTKNPLTAPFAGNVPEESLLFMCGLSNKRMDKLLFALRKAEVRVDYKAALTPTNQKWDVLHLLLEMHAERASIIAANAVPRT